LSPAKSCVFENTEDAGLFRIDYVTSSDGGSTWGGRTRLYTPPSGSSGAPQVVNVGGTLVVSFMSTEATSQSNNVDDDGEMRVVTSTDGGQTWSGSVVTGAAPAHWPGLYVVDDTHFLALYAEDGSGAVSQLYGLV
jgi:Neuraminidase (sialidase)